MTGREVETSRTIVGSPPQTTALRTRGERAPVFALSPDPGVPPVGMLRQGAPHSPQPPAGRPHAHDFVALSYFEREGGTLTLEGDRWPIRAGDLVLVAPGAVVAYEPAETELSKPLGWGVFFQPEALGSAGSGVRLSWRANPLLFPFVDGVGGMPRRFQVPSQERPAWTERLTAMWEELHRRDDAHREAVHAHLTLLLVEVARLAGPMSTDVPARHDPLLPRVFAVIEERYHEGISLADVAHSLHLTPGHLTTEVRRRTGRTVLEWITERRMTQARRLLTQTDLSISEVGHRVGYVDPAYFTRAFRRTHGVTPSNWRRAAGG
ncbi:AraC family transcriptional regulator [Egibacter rhizosphaerae]|nr:AraC family transcriptional regulator [Egibacter rhizosphaerae]